MFEHCVWTHGSSENDQPSPHRHVVKAAVSVSSDGLVVGDSIDSASAAAVVLVDAVLGVRDPTVEDDEQPKAVAMVMSANVVSFNMVFSFVMSRRRRRLASS
jgi:hypothetical protein